LLATQAVLGSQIIAQIEHDWVASGLKDKRPVMVNDAVQQSHSE
jgi:hypothetical protein